MRRHDDHRILTRTEYCSGTVSALFGTRIGGSSNDSTSPGPGIGFRVVLLPLPLLVASRLGPVEEYRTVRIVVKTSCGEPWSAVTRNIPLI